MSKGSAFERRIAKELSLWWSDDTDDAIFYRSDASGARATRRGRMGKATFGVHSDISAQNPIGLPLIQLVTIEAKDGYRDCSLINLLEADRRVNPAKNQWSAWYRQVKESQKHAGTPFWMLITHRKGRKTIVTIPVKLWHELAIKVCTPWARFKIFVAYDEAVVVVVTTFDVWKEFVTPETIKKLHRRFCDG